MLFHIDRIYAVHSALLVILFLQNCHTWITTPTQVHVCNTTDCQKLGEIFQRNMNLRGDPCNDFYDYVCHNWKSYNSVKNGTTVQDSMTSNAFRMVKSLLESEGIQVKDFSRAQTFYRVCMNIPYLEVSSANAVAHIIKNVAAFPILFRENVTLPPCWEIDRRYIKIAGESAFFDISIQQVGFTFFTQLNPLTSPYGSLFRVPGWTKPQELQHYKTFLNSIIRSVARPNDAILQEIVNKDLANVINFREQLDVFATKYDSTNSMKRMSINQFQDFYDSITVNSTGDKKVNWLEVVRATSKKVADSRTQNITELSPIIVNHPYFTELAGLLRNTPQRVIANHIHLYFAERHVARNSQMEKDLRLSVTDYGPNITGVVIDQIERWKTCIEQIDLRAALGKAYVNEYFSKDDKSEVTGLLETAKELLEQEISDSPWLDLMTKRISIEKVKKLKSVIGYPDWYDLNRPQIWKFQSVDPTKMELNYVPTLNRITASAANLQSPIYNRHMPYVIDYGTTLSILAHELQHAFDNDGITITTDGKSPWWPQNMITEHKNRVQCFQEQYNKYKETKYKELSVKFNRNIFGITFSNTVAEDVSDAIGLKLAYLGYKKKRDKNGGVCSVLPGFKSLDCEKLFFIAFANMFCASLSHDHEVEILLKDQHNLPSIRVNGAVANMKEFSAAFNCKPNSALYLNKTCEYWKS